MAASKAPWFAVNGPLVNDYLIVLPMTFVGPETFTAAQVTGPFTADLQRLLDGVGGRSTAGTCHHRTDRLQQLLLRTCQ